MIDPAKLEEWKSTLEERMRRKTDTPKRSWSIAIRAIQTYGKDPTKENETALRAALKEAEIYVPRDL